MVTSIVYPGSQTDVSGEESCIKALGAWPLVVPKAIPLVVWVLVTFPCLSFIVKVQTCPIWRSSNSWQPNCIIVGVFEVTFIKNFEVISKLVSLFCSLGVKEILLMLMKCLME